MATIVFDDTFEVISLDSEKFDNVSRIKAKVCISWIIALSS